MKKLSILLGILLLLSTCHKENPPPEPAYKYNLKGRVVDAQTHLAIPGLVMYLLGAEYSVDCRWGFCGYGVWDKSTTDNEGNFQLSYQADYPFSLNMKIEKIPEGYQCAGLVNGHNAIALCDKEGLYDQSFLSDTSVNLIELLPL